MADDKQGSSKSQVEDTENIEETKPVSDIETNSDAELFDDEQQNKDEDLDLSDEVADDTKPNAQQKQIDSWLGKILEGSASIEDLPAAQKWLKLPILKELKKLEGVSDSVMEATIERKLKENQAREKFAEMKAKLNDADFSSDQKKEISNEFKELRGAGLTEDQALEKALRIVGVSLDSADNSQLKQTMQIPGGGIPSSKPKLSTPEDIMKNVPDSKERARLLYELANKGNKM
jgi:hypothetical protein